MAEQNLHHLTGHNLSPVLLASMDTDGLHDLEELGSVLR